MKETPGSSRRSFVKKLTTVTPQQHWPQFICTPKGTTSRLNILNAQHSVSVNDQVNIALIGAGGQGSEDTNVCLKNSGSKTGSRMRPLRWPFG